MILNIGSGGLWSGNSKKEDFRISLNIVTHFDLRYGYKLF